MGYRSTASFGKRMEFVAMGELMRRGYDVYQTLVDDRGIDCILRELVNETPVYIDLQIKARSKDCQPYDAGRYSSFKISNPRMNYLFMFYSEQVKSYWIIPSLKLVDLANRLKTGKFHLLLTGLKKGEPYPKPAFDSYRNENGFQKIDSTFNLLVE